MRHRGVNLFMEEIMASKTYTVVGSLKDVTIYDDNILLFMSDDSVWHPDGQVFDDQNRLTNMIKLWGNNPQFNALKDLMVKNDEVLEVDYYITESRGKTYLNVSSPHKDSTNPKPMIRRSGKSAPVIVQQSAPQATQTPQNRPSPVDKDRSIVRQGMGRSSLAAVTEAFFKMEEGTPFAHMNWKELFDVANYVMENFERIGLREYDGEPTPFPGTEEEVVEVQDELFPGGE